MITNIQLLRAVAALAVVFFHTQYWPFRGVHNDFDGVFIFFVISGFIIPRITYNGSRDFMLRRIIRIVPLYWIATLTYATWFDVPAGVRLVATALLAGTALAPESILEKYLRGALAMRLIRILGCLILAAAAGLVLRKLASMSHETLVWLLKSLFFIPAPDKLGDLYPYLVVGWTLNLEIYFYALYALALAAHRSLAPLLTSLLLLAIPCLHYAGIWRGEYAEFYSFEAVRYFVYGLGLSYAYGIAEKMSESVRRKNILTAAAGLAAAALVVLFIGSKTWPRSYSIPFVPVLLVAAALLCHLFELRVVDSRILLLGDASYALYLFHFLFLDTIDAVSWTDAAIGMTAAVLASIAAAVAIHRYVELPLLAALRGSCLNPQRAAPSVARPLASSIPAPSNSGSRRSRGR